MPITAPTHSLQSTTHHSTLYQTPGVDGSLTGGRDKARAGVKVVCFLPNSTSQARCIGSTSLALAKPRWW